MQIIFYYCSSEVEKTAQNRQRVSMRERERPFEERCEQVTIPLNCQNSNATRCISHSMIEASTKNHLKQINNSYMMVLADKTRPNNAEFSFGHAFLPGALVICIQFNPFLCILHCVDHVHSKRGNEIHLQQLQAKQSLAGIINNLATVFGEWTLAFSIYHFKTPSCNNGDC